MAIAYDNASGIAHATSVSHTATGAGLVAVVFVGSHSSSAPSGVTYGGVECTFKDGITRLLGANNWYLSVWYIASPATGAQTVAVSGTDAWTFIGVVSFTGGD